MTTFGLEFEVAGISVSSAAAALNRGGIECIEPSRQHQTHEAWSSVYDGSVRGAEVVSPILDPIRLNEASTVARLLLVAGGKVDRTTGFHVHIGAQGLSQDHIAQWYLNWNLLHDAIGVLVAPSRLNNSYCKAVNREHAEANAEHIRNGNISDIRGDRYQSFNLESYQRHGTLEIRLHQGTLNGTKAVAWAKFIDAFKQLSETRLITDLGTGTNLQKCENLISLLVINEHLDSKTGEYLKDRAASLNG
jgi:Putative amidoligase enzyme